MEIIPAICIAAIIVGVFLIALSQIVSQNSVSGNFSSDQAINTEKNMKDANVNSLSTIGILVTILGILGLVLSIRKVRGNGL